MNKISYIINQIRAIIIRSVKPKNGYWLASRNMKPLSTKFGFDRGTPIDRYWIEKFIASNQNLIAGRCLEVGDDRYSRMFGRDRVAKIDIIDINKNNKRANIYGDLRHLTKIPANTYDCIILTHVLGMVDDFGSAISECRRVLKTGGTLLMTSASFSPTFDIEHNFWRFTAASARYAFGKYFKNSKVQIKTYGNVLTGQCFWVGMAQEELSKKELDYDDPKFPCIVGVRATK